ncbi:CRISPR system precrRNA processing endoribonuclease RAMP protein Cas6 [Patescibacteria group bacterium]|nr:CRISPR system precrRNA processing endoribonuclease RAMP protein Cas6 [Patescibacteria group bacterium]
MDIPMDALNSLYLHKYRISIQPEELITLPPYKGSALRGVFGHSLRQTVCIQKDTDCQECPLSLKCVYSYIFETPIPQDDPFGRKYSSAPHPYIITPPITSKKYFKEDDQLDFEVVLIGKANDYLPYFVYTFMEMGKLGIGRGRGRFKLINVSVCQNDGSLTEIFNISDGILRSANNKIDSEILTSHFPFPISHLTITFETPVRIKEEGDLVATDIPFSLLIKRLYERVTLLSYYHCQGEIKDIDKPISGADEIRIKENNLKWYDWERYSNRKGRMKLGGLVGSITYEGNLDKFLPLLRIGEYIHVGKAVTFGLGRYRIKTGE